MNFNRKRSFCVIAVILAINFAVISGKSLDDDLPRVREITTEAEVKMPLDENDELTTDKTKISSTLSSSSSSSSKTTVKSTTAELPLGDEPAKEPNSDLPPEVALSSVPPKESTTVPPLIHNTETSPRPAILTSSSTTTTAVPSVSMPSSEGHMHAGTEPTPSTTTKKPNSATGLHAVQFTCFVTSAMLVLLR